MSDPTLKRIRFKYVRMYGIYRFYQIMSLGDGAGITDICWLTSFNGEKHVNSLYHSFVMMLV
jgi:hypothetical protein